MFRAKIGYKHKGCWLAEISSKFNCLFVVRTSVAIDPASKSSDILYVHDKDDSQFEAVIAYLSKRKTILSTEELYRTKNHMYLMVKTNITRTGSTSRACNYHNCFVVEPVESIKGEEIWVVESISKENITAFMKTIAGHGKTRLITMVESHYGSIGLAPRQEVIVRAAKESGYYEWPRRIDTRALAKRLGISKSTLLEHLRTAEIKIMNHYLKDI